MVSRMLLWVGLFLVFFDVTSFLKLAQCASESEQEEEEELDSDLLVDTDFLTKALQSMGALGDEEDGEEYKQNLLLNDETVRKELVQMQRRGGHRVWSELVDMDFQGKEDFLEKVKPRLLKENKSLSKKKGREDVRPRVTDKVYIDISIGGEPAGRLVIGVFGEIVPKTAKNFVELAKGTKDEQGNTLHYKGSQFHRVIKYLMIHGGSLPGHPTGGASIYGSLFDDENFDLKHYGSGWVSMMNSDKNTNSCQFFITSARLKYLDGKFVVFGKVLEGMDLVRRIEFMKTDDKDFPVPEVKFADTGVLAVNKPFPVNTIDVDPDVTTQLHDEL